MTQIYLGADHGGYELKTKVVAYLKEKDFSVTDLGVFSNDPADYPDIAREVSEKVNEYPGSFGVLVCGTGIGMCMVANKQKNIRAVMCTSSEMSKMARLHNDANVLCLGGRIQQFDEVKPILDTFFQTAFDGGERHKRRISKFEQH